MLQLITTDKTVKIAQDGKVLCISAKNTIDYNYTENNLYLYPKIVGFMSARWADGVELDGEEITPANAEDKLSALFFLTGGGAGGTTDHTRLANRDAAGQHPVGAITGLSEELENKANKIPSATNVTSIGNFLHYTSPDSTFTMYQGNRFSAELTQADIAEICALYTGGNRQTWEFGPSNWKISMGASSTSSMSIVLSDRRTSPFINTEIYSGPADGSGTITNYANYAMPADVVFTNNPSAFSANPGYSGDYDSWKELNFFQKIMLYSQAPAKDLIDVRNDLENITLAENPASSTLPSANYGTIVSKVQRLRDNVKALFEIINNSVRNSVQNLLATTNAAPPTDEVLLVYNGKVVRNEDIVSNIIMPTYPTLKYIAFSTPLSATTLGQETDVTSVFTQGDIDMLRIMVTNSVPMNSCMVMYQNGGNNNVWYNPSDRDGYDFYLRDGDDSYDGWFKLYFNLTTPKVLCVVAKTDATYQLTSFGYPIDLTYDTSRQFARKGDILPIPAPPASGTFTLQSIDGALSWV